MRTYQHVVTVRNVSIYSGTGDPNAVVMASRGSLFLDDAAAGSVWQNTDGATAWTAIGSGGGAGGRASFTLLEAGPADPANGVYTTWAAVHAAAAAVPGLKDIYVVPADPVVAVPVGPAAAYDMTEISLVGQEFLQNNVKLGIADGVTFTGDWTGETSYLTLVFLGTVVPLFTIDTGGAGAVYLMRCGYRAYWTATGTVEMIRVTNDSILALHCDPFSHFGGNVDGGANYEVFAVDALFCNMGFYASGSVTIDEEVVRGLGAAEVFISGGDTYAGLGGSINTNQLNLAGGVFGQILGNQTFNTLDATPWDTSPTEVRSAIDRIAAYLVAMDTALDAAAVAGFPLGPIP